MRIIHFIFFLLPYGLLAQQAIDFNNLEAKWDIEARVQIYFLQGEVFTGKAIQTFSDHPGKFEYEIQAGFITLMLGFYENGDLERKFHFQQGKEHGILTMYYPGGQKYIEEVYHLGQPNGVFMRWYGDGRIAHKKVFEMGKLISEAYF